VGRAPASARGLGHAAARRRRHRSGREQGWRRHGDPYRNPQGRDAPCHAGARVHPRHRRRPARTSAEGAALVCHLRGAVPGHLPLPQSRRGAAAAHAAPAAPRRPGALRRRHRRGERPAGGRRRAPGVGTGGVDGGRAGGRRDLRGRLPVARRRHLDLRVRALGRRPRARLRAGPHHQRPRGGLSGRVDLAGATRGAAIRRGAHLDLRQPRHGTVHRPRSARARSLPASPSSRRCRCCSSSP
jgi:hypothetical protein